MAPKAKTYAELDNPKPANKPPSHGTNDVWKGFVNVEVPEAAKPLVRALRETPDALWTTIIDLIEAGYKMSVTCDEQYSLYNVSLTCRNTKDKNEGYTLSGRGGTLLGAMAAFVYKHTTILEGDWTQATSSRPRALDGDYVG